MESEICAVCVQSTLSFPVQAELAALVSLDLLDCPVTQQDGYRELVFNLLPGLGALDGLNREGEEVEESESEDGEGCRVESESEGGRVVMCDGPSTLPLQMRRWMAVRVMSRVWTTCSESWDL